ncbi:putative RNA helicase [Rosa chinensis]|uniref:Putative RNA helicase n=1 Tax=Rosa chinensis TaxID=74649 RepID=A0A2P6SBI4_ROSCH|nr:putative RNA helicase [Rosa chinensis]
MGDYCTLTGSPRTQHQQLPSRRPVCTTFGHHSHKQCDLRELDRVVKKLFQPALYLKLINLGFPRRDYQFGIIKTTFFFNTLVTLPTELGKTHITAVVMYYFR